MLGGREIWGFPKKLAAIEFKSERDMLFGTLERPAGVRLAGAVVRPAPQPGSQLPSQQVGPQRIAIDVEQIEAGTYDAIIMNYANADMVGHSGKIEPTVKAVETVDACLGRIEAAVRAKGGAMLITADHGNAELMIDPATGGPHTAHTTNPVPFIVVAENAKQFTLKPGGSLRDISPTMLGMLGVDEPKEMTGADLRIFLKDSR